MEDEKNVKNFITIVSGLPRSGTSMMMQMLEAGGVEAVTDKERKADNDNPKGYFEFERVKKLKQDKSWVADCGGKSLKVISALLFDLPSDQKYKVIFMQREMGEVLASQKVMLERRGEKGAGVSDEEMAEKFAKHLKQVEDWLEKQSCLDVLYVKYSEVISRPESHVKTVNEFLGGGLKEDKMAKVIEKALYRQRENQS